MMRVSQSDYGIHNKLLSNDSPSYSGILLGNCKGVVWVDDLNNPTLALVYSEPVGGFSIMGSDISDSTYENFKQFVNGTLEEELRAKGERDFEFSVQDAEVKKKVLNLFKHKKLETELEYHYRYTKDRIECSKSSHEIRRIDRAFLDELDRGCFKNPELLRKKISAAWESDESYCTMSNGFASIHDGYITSLVIGTGRFKNLLSVDIETHKDFRKKGLALSVIQHLIKDSLDRGMVIQWDCVESNIPSIKTAEKAGFSLIKTDRYYWFRF